MSPTPEIRLAVAADLAAVLPLFRAYQDHYGQLTNASEAQTRGLLADLIADPQRGFVLLASVDAKAIGFATTYFTISGLIAQRIAHLGDLYVAPDHRRKGIGTALFNAVSHHAHAHGIELVRWLSLSTNTEANRWYNRLVKSMGTFELFLRPTEAKPTGASSQ